MDNYPHVERSSRANGALFSLHELKTNLLFPFYNPHFENNLFKLGLPNLSFGYNTVPSLKVCMYLTCNKD